MTLALPMPLRIHLVALTVLTALTNAALLREASGPSSVVALASVTLMAASLEPVAASAARRRGDVPAAIARLHMWACGLAAFTAVACALLSIR